MSINIIVPLKLNPIPSRIQSSTPPSLTSSSNLLWILELWEEGGCFLLKHAHGFAFHPPPFLPRNRPIALAWSVRSGSSINLRHPQYLQVHQRTRTPKLSLAPRPFFSRRLHTIIPHSFHHSLPLSLTPSQLKQLH
jgi:hypothetical protein